MGFFLLALVCGSAVGAMAADIGRVLDLDLHPLGILGVSSISAGLLWATHEEFLDKRWRLLCVASSLYLAVGVGRAVSSM